MTFSREITDLQETIANVTEGLEGEETTPRRGGRGLSDQEEGQKSVC